MIPSDGKAPAKVTFEFDYYEDKHEIDLLMRCKDAYAALWDIDCMLRTEMDKDITPEQEKLYQQMRDITSEPLQYYY